MVKESNKIKMEIFIRVNGLMVKNKDKVQNNGKIKMYILVIGMIINKMEQESF